jgi:KUP system potassium uptake protein
MTDEPRPSGDLHSARVPIGQTGARPIPPTRHHVEANPKGKRLAVLSLTALGVVYGDIGTSPLYAIQQSFKPEYGLEVTASNIYGLLSLIVWALIVIVSVKYVAFILRADNRGEGGVLALLALVLQREHREADRARRAALIMIGIFGGAFLYGDGIITPAISVLGALEGLEIVTPALQKFVVPLAFVILLVLFSFQRKGTARVGGLFGWVMLLWFVTIAILGVMEIARDPTILKAVNPWYGVKFFLDHPMRSFVVLGAVVLVITGGEALYADMGHFGRKPIRLVWFAMVLPALLLNYFGQGALVLRDPSAVANPFYLLAPKEFLPFLLPIAISAAIIASQALISGAFSLTQQAVQLGYSPRVTIVHTSKDQAGQIYIPEVNHAMMIGTLLLVVGFGSSTALGAAYGPAMTGTMAITTILFHSVLRHRWGWPRWKANLFLIVFLSIDLAFFASNLLKVPHGGWVPLLVAVGVFTLMTTWKRGRELLREILRKGTLPLDLFLDDVKRREPVRVPGTAVFMTSDPEGAPVVLLHHLKHNKVLHQQVVIMSITTLEVPEAESEERLTVEKLTSGFYRVQANYGFMETPDVKVILAGATEYGLITKKADTTYYLGRERLITTGNTGLWTWRKKLFAVMARNAQSATEFFGIPPNRVVELGAQIEF